MYPFHPLTVHLPIGLLLGNAILTLLYLYRGDQTVELGAWHCLWLGWIGAVFTTAMGSIDAVRQLYSTTEPRNDALGWINAHGIIGVAIVVIYWQAWQLRRRNPRILSDPAARRGYVIRIALGALLIILNGWVGGHMVYTLRLGVTP